jgi:carbonic anhydrase
VSGPHSHRSSRCQTLPFVSGLARAHRLLPLLLLSLGCSKLFAKDTPAPAAAGETGKIEAPKQDAEGEPAEQKEAKEGSLRSSRYGVPFAWEISPEEPLAKARTFLAEVLRANETFMTQGKSHFTPFADAETPRATVLTCSDSRVQAQAWDGNPENDDYTVRNLGNQLSTALGSVEYGIDRLHTPVLLIIGHSGCEAIRAALDKKAKGKGPIADELSHLELPEHHRHGRESEEWSALTKAVVANVDAQVADAVAHFAPYVQSGELTVVGAVYDFQNEFGDGHGRVRLVNVNSNIEPSRIEAFQTAIKAGDKSPAPAFGQRRQQTPVAALIDRTGRPLPGGPRATINAVNVLGNGDFDAVSAGTLRQPTLRPGGMVPGTSDLRVAPSYRPAAPPPTAPASAAEASSSPPGEAPKAKSEGPREHADEHEPSAPGH